MASVLPLAVRPGAEDDLENPVRDELATRLEPLLAAQVVPGGLYEDA